MQVLVAPIYAMLILLLIQLSLAVLWNMKLCPFCQFLKLFNSTFTTGKWLFSPTLELLERFFLLAWAQLEPCSSTFCSILIGLLSVGSTLTLDDSQAWLTAPIHSQSCLTTFNGWPWWNSWSLYLVVNLRDPLFHCEKTQCNSAWRREKSGTDPGSWWAATLTDKQTVLDERIKERESKRERDRTRLKVNTKIITVTGIPSR